jgi:CubicO group peptidase (beta-lactamase class C family)
MDNALQRSDWLRAARKALLHHGPGGVRVEPLARELGVTKGSFYWHFRHRKALLDALLEDWASETALLTQAVAAVRAEQPAAVVFDSLIEEQQRLSLRSERGETPSDAAIFAWAAVDPTVAKRVNAIEAERMALFRELIGDRDAADLIYYAYHGYLLRRRRVARAAMDFAGLARAARRLVGARQRRRTGSAAANLVKPLRNLLLLVAVALPLLNGCTTYRIVRWRDPAPNVQASIFPERRITAWRPEVIPRAAVQRVDLDTVRVRDIDGQMRPFSEYMERRRIRAFVVMRNDSIVYERYTGDMTDSTLWNAFSVSKSFTSALLGLALERHAIGSLDDDVSVYIPELANKPGFEGVTLRRLLGMQSGFAYSRTNGGLWHDFRSSDAHFNYTSNLRASLEDLRRERAPGSEWAYKDSDADLIGWALTNARHAPLAEQLSEDIWHPIGAEHNAFWDLDRPGGLENAASGLNAVANDFLRFGRLYLDGGRVGNRRILSSDWVAASTTLDRSRTEPEVATWWNMQHQRYWWIPMHNWDAEHDFYADGSKGQRIYVHPGTRTVIVQLADDSRQDFPFRKIAHFLAGEPYTYPRSIPGILLGAARHGASTDSLRTLYHTLIAEQSARPADFTINEAMMLALARQLAAGERARPYAIAVAELSVERSPHSAKSRAVLDELEKSPLR